MRDHDEVVNNIMKKTEQYEKQAAERKARRKIVIPSVLLAVAACLLGVIVWKFTGNNIKDPKDNGTVTVTQTPVTQTPGTPTDKPINEDNTPTPTTAPDPKIGSKNLTESVSSSSKVNTKEMDDKMRTAYETFAYKLFSALPEEGTRMISPFSVYMALGMLANGADGNTLAQMDELLGLTAEERNAYLAAWVERLTSGDEDATKFTNADSIWIRDAYESLVPRTFLDVCANYYKAAVYSTPMNDSTVFDINSWVKKNTMNMIDKLIDELSPDAVMFLMNAIALDAKWEEEFSEARTQKDYTFTKEDGTTAKVDMMFTNMKRWYLENDLMTGFMKQYKGGEFSYIAMLPKEGVSLSQLVNSLKPGDVSEAIMNRESGDILIGVPKYTEEYSANLNEVLQKLGMTDVFNRDKSNLTRLLNTEGPTYVSRVIHKTYIGVDEKGTKAAAVTGIEVVAESVSMPYTVIRDRPFVYMIVDSEGFPVFLGTYEGPSGQ